VAAKLRRDLNTEVAMVRGNYGEFKVLVDGNVVIDGGVRVTLGIMPSSARVLATVRTALAAEAPGALH
jgi:hypothetical protein